MRTICLKGDHPRLILDGLQTQFRIPVANPPADDPTGRWSFIACSTDKFSQGKFVWSVLDPEGHTYTVRGMERQVLYRSPYGNCGERLCVREAWCYYGAGASHIGYRATDDVSEDAMHGSWRSPATMKAEDSRLTLELTEVRIERLHAISEEDCKAMGAAGWSKSPGMARAWVSARWSEAHKGYPWDSNPWIWVYSFRKVTA